MASFSKFIIIHFEKIYYKITYLSIDNTSHKLLEEI